MTFDPRTLPDLDWFLLDSLVLGLVVLLLMFLR